MLYKACINPYSLYDTPLYKSLPLDSALSFIYYFIIVNGNYYLYLFLKSQTQNNTALTIDEKKKNRKKNFVNAKSGIISGFVLLISSVVYIIFYGFKVNINSLSS